MTPSLFDPPLQPEPFDAPSLDSRRESLPVRATDPETSVLAAQRHLRSGKASAHRSIVLRLVREHEGSTYMELWAAQAEPRAIENPVEVMRRLNDLVKLGLVVKGPERACRVNGNRKTTWLVTQTGERAT